MTRYLKIGGYGLVGLAVLAVVALFDYWMPDGTVGRIGGTEVKRMDAKGGGVGTRDVRYITMEVRDSRETAVFANEDSALYLLKLDSATVQGRAQNLATRGEPTFALIRHYGWRIPLLSMFPNAISVSEVPADYTYIPWARIVFGILILLLLAEAVRRYFRFRRRRIAAREAQAAEMREQQARRERKDSDIVDDFINSSRR